MGGQQSTWVANNLNYIKAHKKLHRPESLQSDELVNVAVDEDVLINILSFVPSKDLLSNCRLVCKQWKEIIDGHSLWVLKCEREKIQVPKCKQDKIPDNYHRNMYFYEQSKGNYTKNPTDKFRNWNIVEKDGDGIMDHALENDPVPPEVGPHRCFSTPFCECRMYQLIDLYENENIKYLLKNSVVSVKVGEWYAARFDCTCEYKLRVTLLDNAKNEVDEFSFKTVEQHWNGREWNLVSHNFNDVSTLRYVRFEHYGKDRRFWAGQYGSTMTSAFVKFQLLH